MGEIMVRVQRLAALEVFGNRTARRVALVGLFAALTAISAYVTVPLPFTPVPVTLQTMMVILAGVLLGPRLGAASQVTYLAAAAAGAPVFSAGAAGVAHLFGPTGGYLLAFPVAAAVAGWVAGGATARRSLLGTARLGAGLALGAATILVGGAAQLALFTGGFENAVRLGIVPFLIGDGLKVLGALLVAGRLRTRTLGPS